MFHLPSPGWLVAALVVLAVMGHFPTAAVIVVGVAGMIGWYAWSVKRRPSRPCFWCGGRGAVEGGDPEVGFMRRPIGRCPRCHNAKVTARWGTVIFNTRARRAINKDRESRPRTTH